MAVQKIMLKSGDDPLQMDFTEHRHNFGMIFLVGLFILLSGACCITTLLLATGAVKW